MLLVKKRSEAFKKLMVSLMISLLILKRVFQNHTIVLLVADLLKSSEVQNCFTYTIKEFYSLNWIKSAMQEVMIGHSNISTTIALVIYRIIEIMFKLIFI